MVTQGSFPGCKADFVWSRWLTPPPPPIFSSAFKNEYSHNSTPHYSLMAWTEILLLFLLRNKHNQLDTHFTFTFTLLRFKVSTCFGHYLPIFRRHYTYAGLVTIVCSCRCGLVLGCGNTGCVYYVITSLWCTVNNTLNFPSTFVYIIIFRILVGHSFWNELHVLESKLCRHCEVSFPLVVKSRLTRLLHNGTHWPHSVPIYQSPDKCYFCSLRIQSRPKLAVLLLILFYSHA
jgi:hypothetical protein